MRCLLLQGPAGPFFSTLQEALNTQGWKTMRACFDGGDVIFSAKPRIVWNGTTPIQSFLDRLYTDFKPTVIVLFGADRTVHRIASLLAKNHDIPLLCLEEGYLRSGYITAEWGGNNHRSPLLKTPHVATTNTAAPIARSPSYQWLWSFLYYTSRGLFSLPNQRGLHHRKFFFLPEGARWVKNLWLAHRHQKTDQNRLRTLKNVSYDLVALQVPSDTSLTFSQGTWNTPKLINKTLESLASFAPKDRHVVFKLHPMARGHYPYERLIKEAAQKHGMGKRTHILYTGSLEQALENARGLITISSTSALHSIIAGKPTLVLGKGIMAHPTLAQLGPEIASLHQYWTNNTTPTPDQTITFINHLKSTALLPGDFYDPNGQKIAAANIGAKIDRQFMETTTAAQNHRIIGQALVA